MKKIYLTFILICLLLSSHAQAFMPPLLVILGDGGAAIFTCDDYTSVCQSFEGAGYAAGKGGESWDETGIGGATIDEDYAVSPLVSSQSLQIVDAGANGYVDVNFTPHTDGQTCGIYFRFRLDADVSAYKVLMGIFDGVNQAGTVNIGTGGSFVISHGAVGSGACTGFNALDLDGDEFQTDIDVWVEWTTCDTDCGGTGNGNMKLYACVHSSCNGVKPGTAECEVTTGDADYPGIDSLRFYANFGETYILDRVLVDDAAIGSVP